MRWDFEQITTLQYRNRILSKQVEDFKSGEKYLQMERAYKELLRFHHKEIKRLEYELSKAHSETVTVRKYWSEVMDDVDREHAKEVRHLLDRIAQLEKINLQLVKERDEAKDKYRDRNREYYELAAQLEEERERNRKLTVQVNMNFENSSIPSSQQGPKRKKIPNTREKTGRRPGGQPGHKGYCRKKHTPTETHEIPVPEKYLNDPDYYETGKTIRKQRVVIELSVKVIEYITKEYRSRVSGARVHAPFPAGYTNEVNYDGTVKALAFLLSNECNVSHGKIRKLLRELTGGELEISDGMINSLCEEFSLKSKKEKEEIIKRLMSSPVMNADFTTANVNGKNAQVLVLASPVNGAALYIGREKKGHEGIKGTPLADYVGIVVHDHDKTFYKYGTGHQECTQHDCRYLIGSRENEPELEWNHKMHALFQEMLHYCNGLGEDEEAEAAIVEAFERRYDEILDKAAEEYADNPPSDYYREGYNLSVRLREYKESELRFLHDKRVPANNSLCERLARVYKRKQKQAMVLRSQKNLEYICDGLSTVHLLRTDEKNVYQEVASIFERSLPPKSKQRAVAAVLP